MEWLQKIDSDYWLIEQDRGNLTVSYRLKEIIFSEKSTFQHVMIADSYDFGRMLVLDGVVQTTALDGHIYNEMITHVPLFIHKNPEKVLIIGGGDCGAAKEVTKHVSVKDIHMVEIDELVVNACRKHLQEVSGNLSDPRVSFIFTDGIEFVKKTEQTYDVIIVDSSDPEGPAEQLFEFEFYQHLKRKLKDDGILVCQSQSPLFQANITRNTFNNFQELFAHADVYYAVVPTYPGGFWSFTIGSKSPINISCESLVDVNTKYFNKDMMVSSFKLPQFLAKKIIY
ncbi:polyamine aminopropyltransferase [Lederbergia citri]|uniref:Polyamine aminopropyltransferase n=1 Tax=Lederbergia citri TaxID=2833580 RepID=A0A942TFI4_9BACI|nr:polyamine aminopropyltransferase [Lederbergia citri]MBS4195913.1 polyamine aminopropyltransferase [Lederbergia citri]